MAQASLSPSPRKGTSPKQKDPRWRCTSNLWPSTGNPKTSPENQPPKTKRKMQPPARPHPVTVAVATVSWGQHRGTHSRKTKQEQGKERAQATKRKPNRARRLSQWRLPLTRWTQPSPDHNPPANPKGRASRRRATDPESKADPRPWPPEIPKTGRGGQAKRAHYPRPTMTPSPKNPRQAAHTSAHAVAVAVATHS